MTGATAGIENLYLVSCVGKKAAATAPAKDLYASPWFLKARAVVEQSGAPWFILSALHGLVHPDTVLEPYSLSLNEMGVTERQLWAAGVRRQLDDALPPTGKITVFAGAKYREFLVEHLRSKAKVDVPLQGLGIGEQLAWLTRRQGVPAASPTPRGPSR